MSHLSSIEKSASLLDNYKSFSEECDKLQAGLVCRVLFLTKESLLKKSLKNKLPEVVLQAMRLIDENPADASVKVVATKMGYSVVHLNIRIATKTHHLKFLSEFNIRTEKARRNIMDINVEYKDERGCVSRIFS